MTPRNAILAAANEIEKNPNLYSFMSVYKPDPRKNKRGCALGWISYFLTPHRGDFAGCLCIMYPTYSHMTPTRFYGDMDRLSEEIRYRWRSNAEVCAKALRLYADKYFPAAAADSIPQSVRELFKEQSTA